MRALGLILAVMAAPVLAESPSATTATYGNWTLGCQAAEAGQACQIVTRLNLKGQDGQVRPLLSLALARVGAGMELRLEAPMGLDLRVKPRLDLAPAKDEAAPQGDPLAALDWVTCDRGVCLAGAAVGDKVVKALKGAETVEVGFQLIQGGKTVRVPVSMAGFSDAETALEAER